MSRMRASDTGLSTTTTSSGLLEEARTSPQVPSATVTRTPLTVTRSRIGSPATFSARAFACSKCFTTSSTTRYLTSSGQCGAMVGEDQVGHAFCGIAVEHVANREREHEPVVVAAAERRVEEEVAGFLEARDRADLVDAALHVGVAGLPVVDLDAVRAQHRVGHEQAGRLHVGDEGRAFVLRGDVAREHHAHLVGENFLALVVDH